MALCIVNKDICFYLKLENNHVKSNGFQQELILKMLMEIGL